MNFPFAPSPLSSIAGVALSPVVQASKRKSVVQQAIDVYQSNKTTTVPAMGTVEVGFLPNQGSEHLVIKVIQSATKEIDLLSYSFSSVPVVQALVEARHRGVVVRLVADRKDNVSDKKTPAALASRAALGALVNAGADERTISVYPIHHDKVIIVDEQTVELGKFNYSDAVAHRNSENVLVNWGNPKLAEIYLEHFKRNCAQAAPYDPGY